MPSILYPLILGRLSVLAVLCFDLQDFAGFSEVRAKVSTHSRAGFTL